MITPGGLSLFPGSLSGKDTRRAADHGARAAPHFRQRRISIVQLIEEQPVWTLIVTGSKSGDWGFGTTVSTRRLRRVVGRKQSGYTSKRQTSSSQTIGQQSPRQADAQCS